MFVDWKLIYHLAFKSHSDDFGFRKSRNGSVVESTALAKTVSLASESHSRANHKIETSRFDSVIRFQNSKGCLLYTSDAADE